MTASTALPDFELCGHLLRVDVGPLTLWWSYKTLIGFRILGAPFSVVHVNDWGPTTGRHLNTIDSGDKAAKARRLHREEFRAAAAAAIGEAVPWA